MGQTPFFFLLILEILFFTFDQMNFDFDHKSFLILIFPDLMFMIC